MEPHIETFARDKQSTSRKWANDQSHVFGLSFQHAPVCGQNLKKIPGFSGLFLLKEARQ